VSDAGRGGRRLPELAARARREEREENIMKEREKWEEEDKVRDWVPCVRSWCLVNYVKLFLPKIAC
jgi:hypothetical protein